ncbi:MAG: hypothetical protein WCF18_22070, partial [Chthoniobacteraceae bacterium]
MNIEPLESRIAPASLTFTDVDGDKVVITTTGAGTLTLGGNVMVSPLPGAQTQIVTLDLTDPALQGANVSIVATRDPVNGGDGLVNVGSIDASGRDLSKVLVDGDLGQIFAGSGTDSARGLTSLEVGSLGRFGTTTGAPGLAVAVDGKLGSLKVRGDVRETLIFADSIGPITIGGSLIGGAADETGKITTAAGGAIGVVKIGGNIEGGAGMNSGSISAASTLASLNVGGSLIGGAAEDSGKISTTSAAGGIGPMKIAGSIRGGDANFSGTIFSAGALASVTVGGSVIGGDLGQQSGMIRSSGAMGRVKIGGNLEGGDAQISGVIFSSKTLAAATVGGSLLGSTQDSGEIRSTGSMGPVKIGGNVQGGLVVFPGSSESGSGAIVAGGDLAAVTIGGSLVGGVDRTTGAISVTGALGPVKIGGDIRGSDAGPSVTLSDTGFIEAKRIASIFVGGSIIAGTESAGHSLQKSGAIRADNDIGAITIKGSLIGNAGVSVLIIARGQAAPGAGTDVAIRSLTVGGRVERADILAGYTVDGITPPEGVNADAQIGAVIVGAWFTSNLAAGVQDNFDAARNDFFGEGDDRAITGGSDKIASITIKNSAYGTPRVNQGTG